MKVNYKEKFKHEVDEIFKDENLNEKLESISKGLVESGIEEVKATDLFGKFKGEGLGEAKRDKEAQAERNNGI